MALKKFKRKQLSDADIPTASFSDVAFLLIIFFLLTTTLHKRAGFTTEFPSGEATQQQTTAKMLAISLHEDGITLNDQPVTMPQLEKRLSAAKLHEKKGDEKVVVLSATGNVTYQPYYEVMAMVSAAGGVIAIEREITKEKGK